MRAVAMLGLLASIGTLAVCSQPAGGACWNGVSFLGMSGSQTTRLVESLEANHADIRAGVDDFRACVAGEGQPSGS